ncbi:biotin transporter BioY [Salisaeta longa]|uniref:biotin transporter BioY n=1 Tax=Salisaeta longa TaxID=503170 RepID=UPI0003B588A6|nr:biotin transporter BioY [Salisaeta longa]
MTKLLSLRSTRASWIDGLREEQAAAALQVLGIAGFALLTALGAQFSARVYLWEVPITLQTLAVYGSGLFLGARNGLLAQLLYLSLGLFVPVYAGDGTGVAYFAGAASAGYLLAYPFAAAVVGFLSKRWKTLAGSTVAMLAGSALLFTVGVSWLHYAADHASWWTSIDRGWLRFVVIDLAKIIAVAVVYSGVRGLFPAEDA